MECPIPIRHKLRVCDRQQRRKMSLKRKPAVITKQCGPTRLRYSLILISNCLEYYTALLETTNSMRFLRELVEHVVATLEGLIPSIDYNVIPHTLIRFGQTLHQTGCKYLRELAAKGEVPKCVAPILGGSAP